MREIEKLDIAIEQIEDALSAYFDARYHSAIVLAGASEQLLAGYVLKHGSTPAWKSARLSLVEITKGLKKMYETSSSSTTEKKVGDVMNRVHNNSKHAGKTDHSLRFDPKFEALQVVARAVLNFETLSLLQEYDLPELQSIEKLNNELIKGVKFED